MRWKRQMHGRYMDERENNTESTSTFIAGWMLQLDKAIINHGGN